MKLNWKDIFSVRLYVEGLKKIRLLGIAAAITTIVLNAIWPVSEIMERRADFISRKTVLTYPQFIPFGLVMLLFTVLMVHSMFSYLNERKDSDFYHAIPQKRICVYLSFLAAILSWVLGVLVASSLVNALLWGCVPHAVYPASAPFLSVLLLFLASAMVGAFMALAMMLTGTNISNFLIFALFFLFVRVVGYIFVSTLADVLPIFDVNYSFWRIFGLEFFLPFAAFAAVIAGEVSAISASLVWYSVGVTVVLYALAGLCYVKRRSEMATRSAPNSIMQHVYRCAVTYPFLLILAMLSITDGLDLSFIVLWLAIALLVYVIFELVTTKKIKNAIKALPLFLIPVAMTFVFTFAVYGTRNVVLDNTPDADEIKSIGIYSNVYGDNSYNDLRIDEIMIDDSAAKQLVEDVLDYASEAIEEGFYNRVEYYKGSNTTRVNLKIKLSSGRTIGRKVKMRVSDLDRLQGYFMNSPAYREASLALPEARGIGSVSVNDASFEKDAIKRIWETFISEYEQLTDGQKQAVLQYPYSNGTSPLTQIIVMGTYSHEAYETAYPISVVYTPKTAQLYLDLLHDTEFYAEQTKQLRELCEQMQKGTSNDYFNCSFNLTVLTGEGNKDIYIHLDSDSKQTLAEVAPVFEIFYTALERELPLSEGIAVRFNYWMDINKGMSYSSSYSAMDVSCHYSGALSIVITEEEYEILQALNEKVNK